MEVAKLVMTVDTASLKAASSDMSKFQAAAKGMDASVARSAVVAQEAVVAQAVSARAAARAAIDKIRLSKQATAAERELAQATYLAAKAEETRQKTLLASAIASKKKVLADMAEAAQLKQNAIATAAASRATLNRINTITGVNRERKSASESASVFEKSDAGMIPRDMMPNRFNTANIAAQFQDIGVTAGMGMSPMLIAMQQGTQLSAIINSMENPLKGIAQAFSSIINPISLFSIAAVGLVAALIQMTDWMGVVRSTMELVATGLEVIGPYAAAAAAALALFFSPVILTGLASATLAVFAMGKAALVAGAQFAWAWMMANPATMIAALVAVSGAVVAWAASTFKPVREFVNNVIGAFVGLWEVIKKIFTADSLSKLFTNVFNFAIKTVKTSMTFLVNSMIDILNKAIDAIPEQFRLGITRMNRIAEENSPVTPLLEGVVDFSAEMQKAMSVDYAGAIGKNVAEGFKSAADWVRSKMPSLTVEEAAKGKGTKTKEKDSVWEKDAMDAIEARLNKMKEAFDFAKDAGKGFFQEIKQGLMEGRNLWETFGNAVTGVLEKILDRLMEVGVDQLFSGISGMSGGTGFGNILSSFGSLLGFAKGGAFTNGVYSKPTPFAFAGGGAFGVMGEAGPEAVMPLQRGPDGSLGVKLNGSTNTGGNVIVNVNNNSSASANVRQRQTNQGVEIDVMIDEMVAQKLADPASTSNRALSNFNSRQLIRR